jgi:hypothetical protein
VAAATAGTAGAVGRAVLTANPHDTDWWWVAWVCACAFVCVCVCVLGLKVDLVADDSVEDRMCCG